MRNHPTNALALAAASLFMVACPGGNDGNTDASDDAVAGVRLDGAAGQDLTTTNSDTGLACCPTGYDLYDCQLPGGGAGFACHNPALGCASSQTCGQGCDPQVSGRCPLSFGDAAPTCIDNVLCIQGDHFDTTLCKCVPDTTPTTPACGVATDCTGALPALCQLCPDGGSACAHFTCVAGQCQVAYCP